MKKRVFLDECCSELGSVFGTKAHVYTAKDLGVTGKEDPRVIDKAVDKKCLIVTVNKDFVGYYRNHPRRKGKNGEYFYGLIFLKHSKQLRRKRQLEIALDGIAWDDTRQHDDLIRVSADGRTRHERLCHPWCAAEFPKEETEWD
jgi:hypothetical protein